MVMIYLFLLLVSIILIAINVFGDRIEKEYNKKCEQWKREQIKAGVPEKFVDQELLSNDFII